jgi:hypothetical protein
MMKKYILGTLVIGLMASCTITRPYAVTNNPIGSKRGVSKTSTFISYPSELAAGVFVSNKNFGVIEAAKKGKINKVATVDVKKTNYLFFQKVEVIVTGE